MRSAARLKLAGEPRHLVPALDRHPGARGRPRRAPRRRLQPLEPPRQAPDHRIGADADGEREQHEGEEEGRPGRPMLGAHRAPRATGRRAAWIAPAGGPPRPQPAAALRALGREPAAARRRPPAACRSGANSATSARRFAASALQRRLLLGRRRAGGRQHVLRRGRPRPRRRSRDRSPQMPPQGAGHQTANDDEAGEEREVDAGGRAGASVLLPGRTRSRRRAR